MGSRTRVIGNLIVHNGQLGVGGVPVDSLIADNQVAYNNEPVTFAPSWEAGGIKFGAARNSVIRNNYVHDNGSSGIWCDVNSKDIVIAGNRVSHNLYQGILYEISYDAVIRNNVVTGNGSGRAGRSLYGANILISSSGSSQGSARGIDIHGNRVAAGRNGIGVIQQDRSRNVARFGPHVVTGVHVHDNVITMARGVTGAVNYQGTGPLTRQDVRFDDNTYYLATRHGHYFRWRGYSLRAVGWRGYRNDTSGRFRRSHR
jgi:parallel beta-helix repeat protein